MKEQIIFIKTYDRFGRLINLETDGNGYGVPNIREGCQEIDRVYYTYSDSISPKQIELTKFEKKSDV